MQTTQATRALLSLLLVVATAALFGMYKKTVEPFGCNKCRESNNAPYFQWMPMLFSMPAPQKCPEIAPVIVPMPSPQSAPSDPVDPPKKPPTTTPMLQEKAREPPAMTPTLIPQSSRQSEPNISGNTSSNVTNIDEISAEQKGLKIAAKRSELLPLINQQRSCMKKNQLVKVEALDAAAQKLANEIITTDMRTDYPQFSIGSEVTVQDRAKSENWAGELSSLQQIIQYSKQLHENNTSEMFIKDVMCDNPTVQDRQKTKELLMSEDFNCVGIGWGVGNEETTKTNTKSVYVIVLGKDSKIVAPAPDTSVIDNGTCLDWSLPSNCPPVEP